MKKTMVLIALAAASAGCVTNWAPRAGATDFASAKWDCMQRTQMQGSSASAYGSERFVAVSLGVMAIGGAIAQRSNFSACMNAAGWAKQE